MKKFSVLLLVLVLALSACSSDKKDKDSSKDTKSKSEKTSKKKSSESSKDSDKTAGDLSELDRDELKQKVKDEITKYSQMAKDVEDESGLDNEAFDKYIDCYLDAIFDTLPLSTLQKLADADSISDSSSFEKELSTEEQQQVISAAAACTQNLYGSDVDLSQLDS